MIMLSPKILWWCCWCWWRPNSWSLLSKITFLFLPMRLLLLLLMMMISMMNMTTLTIRITFLTWQWRKRSGWVSITRSKEWPGDKSTLSLSLQETHGTTATDPALMQTFQSGCFLLFLTLQETCTGHFAADFPQPPTNCFFIFVCKRKQHSFWRQFSDYLRHFLPCFSLQKPQTGQMGLF